MFGNKEKNLEKIKDAETIIGGSIKVKGNFHGKGNIIVEGSLEGSLKTDASLLVGEKAKISANVLAKDAFVNGSITGNVKIEKDLFIGKTAKITGDISCEQVSIEKGAIINGNFIMSPASSDKGQERGSEKAPQAKK
ncbi:MAG: polymer-forming cytoskeletal protein [Candidatus Pacebacteria bacterium]|nr:polymer-forming cytoskeletal protein [Candidatus Paceibacterota bacterium]